MAFYKWYDHGLLRETGEADAVERAIEEHDFEAFTTIRKRYPERDDIVFFPRYAVEYINGERKRYDVTRKSGFNKITESEYECG